MTNESGRMAAGNTTKNATLAIHVSVGVQTANDLQVEKPSSNVKVNAGLKQPEKYSNRSAILLPVFTPDSTPFIPSCHGRLI